MRDFANDMSNERRALAEGPAPAPPSARRNALQQPQIFVGDGEQLSITSGALAIIINEAILVGRGRVPLKNLAERLQRFGVRRKA